MESELTFKLPYTLLLVAADGNEPVQIRLHKSLRLWNFYVDLRKAWVLWNLRVCFVSEF